MADTSSDPGLSSPPFPVSDGVAAVETRFRWRLQAAVLLLIMVATVGVLLYTQRKLAADAETGMEREFQAAFESLREVNALRSGMLLDRCRDLVRRLHLESAPSMVRPAPLYEATRSVLGGVMRDEEETAPDHGGAGFHVEFYRFLDENGRVLEPEQTETAGKLLAGELRQLVLPGAWSDTPQFGTLIREQRDADGPLYDIITVPLVIPGRKGLSPRLVLGIEPASQNVAAPAQGIRHGTYTRGRLFLDGLKDGDDERLSEAISAQLAAGPAAMRPRVCTVAGEPNLMLVQQTNPGSGYPPVYQVGLYPLATVRALQRQLRWQILGLGMLFLLGGLVASRMLASRFARTVERLVEVSAQDRYRRRHAESALREVSADLQRAARFSSDASHQLKTPVTVLRSGLEELRANNALSPAAQEELDALVGQTYRLNGLIEDLLLLSRIEAGRLSIRASCVDLILLLESALDDWGIRPDVAGLSVEKELPQSLWVEGELRYLALIMQNLLENAAKYNRPGGRVRVRAGRSGPDVRLTIGNTTAHPIPAEAQAHVFDRFHRGGVGENVPGYGLGLNLARELARLHHGDIVLLRSDAEWTEFEVRLPAIRPENAGDIPE